MKSIVERIELILGEIAQRSDANAETGEKKYGSVKFADPKNKKYPIDTEEHIRAAWSYIHMPKNSAKYSSSDVSSIKSAIAKEWKSKISSDGPQSAKEKK